jgi:iron complex outermembrane receptor protein
VPVGAYVQSQTSSFAVFQGGNPNLSPETGYSLDSGVDFRPSTVPGLRVSIDVHQITLNGYIETSDDETVLELCADEGRPDICGLIKRYADGNIASISAVPRNFGKTTVAGADLSLDFLENTPIGRFKLGVMASFLARHDTELFAGSTTIHEAGTYSPYASALLRWRSLAHLDYDRGPWHASYSTQWIGGYTECKVVGFQNDPDCRRVDNVFYHDVEAAYTIFSGLMFRLGVRNLTDRQPPFLNFGNEANTDTTTYRLLGRNLFAAVRYQLR